MSVGRVKVSGDGRGRCCCALVPFGVEELVLSFRKEACLLMDDLAVRSALLMLRLISFAGSLVA